MAEGGSIFTEDYLRVSRLDRDVEAVALIPGVRVETNLPVLDRAGNQLAAVSEVQDDTTGKQLGRVLFSFVLGGGAGRDVYRLRVLGREGETLLEVGQEGRAVRVRSPDLEDIGVVDVIHRSGRHRSLEITFYPPEAYGWIRRKKRQRLASMTKEVGGAVGVTDFDDDVIDAAGAPVARLMSDDTGLSLELRSPVSDQLRRLLIGFLCANVKQSWLRSVDFLPPPGTGGH